MGQYYHVLTEVNNIFSIYNLSVKDTDSQIGFKLMEHSWWDNDFCEALSATIVNCPTKIAWIGDHANHDDFEKYSIPIYLNSSWYTAKSISLNDFTINSMKYLVNNSQKVFIDLREYYAKSADDEGWCIHPIPLLTAIGNGRGGGDYHKGTCIKQVGSWAFNEIYLTNQKPKSFTKKNIYFIESNTY